MPDFFITQAALRTTAGTQDFTFSGFGTPGAGARGALVFISGTTGAGTQVDHALYAQGATDGTRFFSMLGRSVDAVSPSSTVSNNRDDRVCFMTNFDGTSVVRLFFNAWITDGIRFDITITGTPSAFLCTVVLIGGSGISNVYVGTVQIPGPVNTATTVSALAAAPTFLITMNPSASSSPFDEADFNGNYASIGIVQNTGSDPPPQYSSNWFDNTLQNPTAVYHRLDTNSVAADPQSTREVLIQEFTSTGFKAYKKVFNDAASAGYIGYIAVTLAAGLSAKVMAVDAPTATGTQTITGIGSWVPQFGMLLQSANDAQDALANGANAEVFGVGLMTAATQASLAVWSDDNNVVTSNAESIASITRAVLLRRDAATFFDATFNGFTSDTATFNYATSDGTTRKWAALFVQAGSTALTVNVGDATTVTESVTTKMSRILLSVSDSVTISEADFIQSAIIFSKSVNDATAVTESSTVLLAKLKPIVFDSTAVTDGGISITYAQTTLAVNVFDSVVMFDLTGGIATFQYVNITVSDAVGVNRGYAIISWNANTEPDLAGYRIYQGTASGVYDPVTLPYNGGTADYYDVGNVLTYTVLNLDFGTTYYFVVTAYDNAVPPNESAPSAEVSKTPTDILLGNVQISQGALSVNDATSITDASAMNMILAVNVNDGPIIVTENHTLLRPFNAVAPFDTVTLAESTTITLTTQSQVFISVFDSTGVTEFVNAQFSGIVNVNDATAITDSVTLRMSFYLNAPAAGQDTTSITDAVTMLMGLAVVAGTLTVSDSTTVTDGVTLQMGIVLLNVFDNVFTSDGFLQSPRLVGVGGNNTNVGRLTNIAGTSPASVIT